MTYDEIYQDVQKRLSEYRFTHSIGVAKKAKELAKIYGVDEKVAEKVGIAHDLAKELSDTEMLNYANSNNIEIDEIEKNQPDLLHGKIAADIAKKEYGFNEDMQNAIRWHTTGRTNMSKLEKIIYIADKTEENRKGDRFDLEKSRALSKQDLDKTIIFLMDEFIIYGIKNERIIHPCSVSARNYLLFTKNHK